MTAGEGGKAEKTVGNAAVASNSPSYSSTATHIWGVGAKIAAVNVNADSEGGSGGSDESFAFGGGGGGVGSRDRLLIGSEAEIVGGIGAAYYLDLILDSTLSEIGIGGWLGLGGGENHVELWSWYKLCLY